MKRFWFAAWCFLLPTITTADGHVDAEPTVYEVYDCSLKEGAAISDVVNLGSGDFADFVSKHEVNMSSYLWEAVSVNEPYDDADFRWVNYYPTWSDYFTAINTMRANGEKISSQAEKLMGCDKPDLGGLHLAGADVPEAPEKPLYIRVCKLKPGNTIKTALAYRKAVNKAQNSQLEGAVGSFVFTPGFGNAGFDYAAAVTGLPADMIQLMDNFRDGSVIKILEEAGVTEVGDCSTDLHRSYMMVAQ